MTVKQQVLQALEQSRGEAIPGQELADKLGVSRTAVWKAVHALQQEGHRIQNEKRGYTLKAESDMLSVAGIQQYLDESVDIDIRIYPQIDSTNDEAKRLAAQGVNTPTLLVSEEQTAGKGRLGRTFYSPKQNGCYFTLLLQPHTSLETTVQATLAAAVAVCRAVEECSGMDTEIKWVNDVYLHGKKLCGILTEAVTDFESQTVSSLIIGIGINTGALPEEIPAEVREIAASLYDVSIGRNRLIARVVSHLLSLLTQGSAEYLPEYRRRSMILGKEITYEKQGVTHTAVAKEIDEVGGLVVEENRETHTLRSGEVSVRPRKENS